MSPSGRAENRTFQIIPVSAFKADEPLIWCVKHVLPRAGLAMIFGQSGTGKTFFVIDLMVSIAGGLNWQDRKVTQGRVLYIAAEGATGIQRRIIACCRRHRIDPQNLDLSLINAAPNLLSSDYDQLLTTIRNYGDISVLIIDTLAQVTPGADENSATDMNALISKLKALQAAFNALIIVVHHSGKDRTKDARGWSGIRAALDTEIEITNKKVGKIAAITKQKDGSDNLSFSFDLDTVHVGVDEDGDAITTCVVLHNGLQTIEYTPKGAWQKNILKAAIHLTELCDGNPPEMIAVIDAVVSQTPSKNKDGKRDSRVDSAHRALNVLLDRMVLKNIDGKILISASPQHLANL